MTSYTKQQTFEFVATSLLKQNAKSTENNEAKTCMYRSLDGSKCAAGFCIPDDAYDQEMEWKVVSNLVEGGEHPDITHKSFFGHDTPLLEQLQKVHDNQPVPEWRNWLIEVGRAQDLDASFLRDNCSD